MTTEIKHELETTEKELEQFSPEAKEVAITFNREEKSNLAEHIEHMAYKLQNLKDILDVLAIWLENEGECMTSNAVSAGSDSLEMILKVHVKPIMGYFFKSPDSQQ